MLPKLGEAFVLACLGAPVSPRERVWASWKRGTLTWEDGSIKDQDEPREEIPLHLDV